MSWIDQDRVMSVLAEAVELPKARRAAFLDSTCAGEPELRREVEELLACADPAAAVFDAAAQHIVQPDPDQIGPYEIVEPVGEGGMAVVYKAQQQHPVRRTVALKLIKLGMHTRQFVARFEAERQALAMMDHPNVARVYDAGSTDTGRPYFVMEFVRGESLLEYCDNHSLDLRARLELFSTVCEAIEHAHRKGIIHRDIKDSNVLITEVDGRAVPKVIDFGVAKALQQPLNERALQTEHGQLIGTPEYMSPEQAERGVLDIDTRSDVYSLGVLLYELIAGVQPISSHLLRSGSYAQVLRIIRETEPPRPSTRLSQVGSADAAEIAQRRRTALPALIRSLRSELEWIPLKAMRKDREQRYRSAAELADDVRNYLEGQPLIAGPESTGYRLRKFLRRHKAGVVASAAMIILLVGGIIATTWQAVRATRAERIAAREADTSRKQAAIAKSVNELMTGMIAKANRGKQQGDPNVTVRAVMDAAAAELNAGTTSHEPEVEAALRCAIGDTYRELGSYDAAEPMLRAALEQRIRIDGTESYEVAAYRSYLMRLLVDMGEYEEAETLSRQVLATARQFHGNEHVDTASALHHLANLLSRKGDYTAAEPLYREALTIQRTLYGDEHPNVASSLSSLSVVLIGKGDYDAAEPVCREALAIRRIRLGNESTEVATTLGNLGILLLRKGEYAEAEAHMRESLSVRRKLLGKEHPDTARSMHKLAGLLLTKGNFEAAEPLFRESLALWGKSLGDDHPEVLTGMSNLGGLLRAKKDYAAAEPVLRDALDRSRRVNGDEHPNTLAILRNLGWTLSDAGRFSEAEPLLFEVYHGAQHAQISPKQAADYVSFYGPCLVSLGRYQDAEQPLREAYDRLLSAKMEKHARTKAVLIALADVCDHTNRPAEAAHWRAELHKLSTAQPATSPS